MSTPHAVTPRVQLLAYTTINREVIGALMDIQGGSTDAETLVTFAGRQCYESFHRPSKNTYHDPDYIKRTVFEQGHGSILEHATATLYFTGVSRAFLAEITRHRHLSPSVLSQRFVSEENAKFVIPPALRSEEHQEVADNILTKARMDLLHYQDAVNTLMEAGSTRKQAREAARGILPNMTETKIVLTGNLRAWHDTIARRTAPDADAEMIEVMTMAREKLADVSPVIFGDK